MGKIMNRTALENLNAWKEKPHRKPLVIRGARQVGKSWLVREFAQTAGMDLFEINFELDEDLAECFKSKHPDQILSLLELKRSQRIVPGSTVLFLDEIQSAPLVFASLRYFYELMPDLHVIAAGSLLEFVLEKPDFSMPVGRIEYLHLGPMTFKEFLSGIGKDQLVQYMENFKLSDDLPMVIHNEFLHWLKLFLAVGGMPEAVRIYRDTRSLLEVDAVKQSILQTYRDDFNKYSPRANPVRLNRVFQRLPLMAGQKVKYVNIDRTQKNEDLKKALHLLELARVYYPVYHTSANGIPLKAQINEKFQKPLFLDVGLMMSACGMSYADIQDADDADLVNSGPVCEQMIGQHLLYRHPSFQEPELFYWCREKRQASSEVDFVIHKGIRIIPVEVKAGKTGTLKSLHVFLKEKKYPEGVRFNIDLPAMHEVPFALPDTKGTFLLLSLPLYMVEELDRHI